MNKKLSKTIGDALILRKEVKKQGLLVDLKCHIVNNSNPYEDKMEIVLCGQKEAVNACGSDFVHLLSGRCYCKKCYKKYKQMGLNNH